MNSPLVILGASGHARVILDAARCQGWNVKGFLDAAHPVGTLVDGFPVLGDDTNLPQITDRTPDTRIILGIGDNNLRQQVARTTLRMSPSVRFATIVHPRATIAEDVLIGSGCFIAAGVTVNTGTRLGEHVVLNTNASVDHDCQIADFSFVGPNAALAGGVQVAAAAFVGIGASLIQCIKIGKNSVVGAGSVVLRSVPRNQIWAGVPATCIRNQSPS